MQKQNNQNRPKVLSQHGASRSNGRETHNGLKNRSQRQTEALLPQVIQFVLIGLRQLLYVKKEGSKQSR